MDGSSAVTDFGVFYENSKRLSLVGNSREKLKLMKMDTKYHDATGKV
jgi:hypothetical protein